MRQAGHIRKGVARLRLAILFSRAARADVVTSVTELFEDFALDTESLGEMISGTGASRMPARARMRPRKHAVRFGSTRRVRSQSPEKGALS